MDVEMSFQKNNLQAVGIIHHMLSNIRSVKSLTAHQNQSPFHLPAGKQRMGEVNNTFTDFGFGLQLRQPLAVSTVAAVFNI